MRHAMIMAGGAGTRLWPMSRAGQPKQLVEFIEDERTAGDERVSLLRVAFERLEGLIPLERRAICTGDAFREQIKAAVPGTGDANIIGEPMGRDTLNAVGLTAAIFEKHDPEAVFAVLTADHLITPDETFREVLDTGFRLVEENPDRLVTFAITPTYPATGFGYVKRGAEIDGYTDGAKAYVCDGFFEKPVLAKAEAYIASGQFGWNSGMFVWKASTFMRCLEQHKPETAKGVREIAEAWGTDKERKTIDRVYPELEKISVDYGVMEPVSAAQKGTGTGAPHVCVVDMDVRWLDVGSWPSYGETLAADEDDNRVSGLAALMDCRNALVVNDDPAHLVAAIGLEEVIVVHTDRATLIMPADRAQDLKKLHGTLEDKWM